MAKEGREEISDRAEDVRRVLWITLALNLFVAAAKLAYGVLTHTLSIRADGFHSITDSTNNVIGIVGIWLAGRPPDKEHPYGHHKFEILATGAIGVSLLAVAFNVGVGAVERLTGNAPAANLSETAYWVLGLTLVVNLCVAYYERRRGLALNSPLLLSDSAHTRADILVTAGVIVAVVFIRLGYPAFDLIAAGAISLFIAYTGVQVLKESSGYLIDTALVSEEMVRDCVEKVPGVASTHKIRTRGTPSAIYVDLHIQIAPHLNVVQAHRVTHWAIDAVRAIPGVVDVVVHTEPAKPGQPYCALPWEDDAAS